MNLTQYLTDTTRPWIMVVGDIMLDEYVYCDVVGQSPEDEVALKLRPTKSEWKGGGAMNVALNLSTLGADVSLIGRVGDDDSRRILQHILLDKGIQLEEIISEDCPTTKKTRYITNKQHRHVVRIDEECVHSEEEDEIVERISTNIERYGPYDRVIVSDYGKGVITSKVINTIQQRMGTKFIVDPKRHDFEFYGVPEAITPNETEYLNAKSGYYGKPKCSAAHVVETRSAGGAFIHSRDKGQINQHTSQQTQLVRAREVGDPAGCGDSFIATFTYARARGASIEEATALGCAAGACAYDHVGVHNVSKEELLKELATFPYGGKA